MADDPYATLGVAKNASDEDIRRAFRKLAKELHPDISKGNEETFLKRSSLPLEMSGWSSLASLRKARRMSSSEAFFATPRVA